MTPHSSITSAVVVAIRRDAGPARYKWASCCVPWRHIGGTGGRTYVVQAKRRKVTTR